MVFFRPTAEGAFEFPDLHLFGFHMLNIFILEKRFNIKAEFVTCTSIFS